MKFKNNFKKLQEQSGYTVKKISEWTGISQGILYKMRNNPYYNITLETIDKLCDFFNCEPSDLIIPVDENDSLLTNKTSVEKTIVKVNDLESIVEYVKRLPPQERDAVEGIYKRVLEAVIMAMEK